MNQITPTWADFLSLLNCRQSHMQQVIVSHKTFLWISKKTEIKFLCQKPWNSSLMICIWSWARNGGSQVMMSNMYKTRWKMRETKSFIPFLTNFFLFFHFSKFHVTRYEFPEFSFQIWVILKTFSVILRSLTQRFWT